MTLDVSNPFKFNSVNVTQSANIFNILMTLEVLMVLGCTEIPVGMKMYDLSYPCVDAMKALALASIQYAGYEVK